MKKEVTVIAHNIRSMHNVGSFFRTADGAGISKIYLTGYTACPPRKEIAKTALGAENTVSWEYHKDPQKLIIDLKEKGVHIVALERNEASKNIQTVKIDTPTCLILGNEVDGVESDLLKLSDEVVDIPMHGKKESLNVSVAFGVAAYQLTSDV